jgi:hypothetical protein
LPAGQTARQDLKAMLDMLHNHPNVGPFIGKQLIQRLVTSNPSPAYVSRVSAAFANNGSGVRGDMKAVIRAVLMDVEARDPAKVNDPKFGKLREPVHRWVQYLRTFTTPNAKGRAYYDFNWMTPAFVQWPFASPSVFNFFRPTYSPIGPIAQAGMVAPEFQITQESSIASMHNAIGYWVYVNPDVNGWEHKQNYGWITTSQGDPALLVDRLDKLLTYGTMSTPTKQAIIEAVAAIPFYNNGDNTRTKLAMSLVLSSPDYLIQK